MSATPNTNASALAQAVSSVGSNSASTAPSTPGKKIKAYFPPGHAERQRLLKFLDATYQGGSAYKDAVDADGNPVLILHEAETGQEPQSLNQAIQQHSQAVLGGTVTPSQRRYLRRKQGALYENHARPVIDKFTAYLTRTPPKRGEAVSKEAARLCLDYHMTELTRTGLALTESWIGWDAASFPVGEDGQPVTITVAQAEAADPVHKGQKYIVSVHPSRVIDWDEDSDDSITRVVIEEEQVVKGGFTKKAVVQTYYREWHANEWVLYKKVDGAIPSGDEIEVEEVKRNPHTLGRCPYIRFTPRFPTEDLAEISKQVFNVASLLMEELAQCTFTQHWITGERADNLKQLERAAGNLLVIEPQEAKVGSFGALPECARVLMEQLDRLITSLYTLVSMENSSTKNVAETAEKKKRDLESLYTMLLDIVKDVEEAENELLEGMGLVSEDAQDDAANSPSQYDRQFDVQSVAELMADLEALAKLSFVPVSLRRTLAVSLAQKMDTFGDHKAYREEVDQLPDTDSGRISAVGELMREGLTVPELVMLMLGIPDKHRAAVEAAMAIHSQPVDQLPVDANGNPVGDNADPGALPGDPQPGLKNDGSGVKP